jgi:hypothetical protein
MNRIPEYGSFKADYIQGSGSVSGQTWSHLVFLGATIFSSLTGEYAVTRGALVSGTFPAGLVLAGNFTEMTLVSGTVWAVRSHD